MKLSEKPTDFLMLKARTSSQWDNCDFVIVEVSTSWQELMLRRLALLEDFKSDVYFFSHVYWDAPEGYFIYEHQQEDSISSFLADYQSEWCFIELKQDELDDLTIPENKLEAHQIVLTASGGMHYKAYGKHSGESFWTESIDLPSVLEKLKT